MAEGYEMSRAVFSTTIVCGWWSSSRLTIGSGLLGYLHSLLRQSFSNLTCLIVIWAKVKRKKCSLCYFWWGGHLRLGFWWIDVAPKMPLSSLLQSQSFHFMKTSSSDMGEKFRSRYFQRSLVCMSQKCEKKWRKMQLKIGKTCIFLQKVPVSRNFAIFLPENFRKTSLKLF